MGQVELDRQLVVARAGGMCEYCRLAEIARRLGKTREYIRLLTEGKRGNGDFPSPIAGVSQKSLLWSWKQD